MKEKKKNKDERNRNLEISKERDSKEELTMVGGGKGIVRGEDARRCTEKKTIEKEQR